MLKERCCIEGPSELRDAIYVKHDDLLEVDVNLGGVNSSCALESNQFRLPMLIYYNYLLRRCQHLRGHIGQSLVRELASSVPLY